MLSADSNVPVIALCTSNNSAIELYEAGADYVVQQDFLAAKEIGEIMHLQFDKGRHLSNDTRCIHVVFQKDGP